MPRPAALVAAALLALLLSGCSDAPDEPPATPDANGALVGDDGNVTLALPTWAVGDYWAYGIEAGPGEESQPAAYVVTGEQGADWTLDSDSDERAFQDARDDISRLGPQRKSDLAGSQGADRVEFFHWPLKAGDSWRTRWDHQDVTIRVVSVDAQKAVLTASNATQKVYDYTYSASAGWFDSLERYAPDGSTAVKLVRVASGHNWTGTVLRYTVEPLVQGTANGSPGNALVQPNVVVAEGVTDVWMSYDVACGQGALEVSFTPQPPDPAKPAYTHHGPCSGPVAFAGVALEAPQPGPYTFSIAFAEPASAPAGIDASYVVLARTRTELAVP